MKIVIATHNPHKLAEIKALFHGPHLDILSALDFPDIPDVIEDGVTLEENAIKKAVTLARATQHWALADDTGLEVTALNGAPGVHSARYAGEPTDYDANNKKLLHALQHETDRTARFRTVIALASPSGRAQTVEGICEGHIAHHPHGTNGFGYDPLFVPLGKSQSFADLDADEKNAISHRGRALIAAHHAWNHLFTTTPTDWP